MAEQHKDVREYFRLPFEKPLCTSMRIVKINGKSVDSGICKICIHDISPGGLCFRSNLKLPAGNSLLLEFGATILSKQHKFYGNIVREKVIDEVITEYGVKFNQDYTKEADTLKIVNELAISLRRRQTSQIVFVCSFCTKEPYNCLRAC